MLKTQTIIALAAISFLSIGMIGSASADENHGTPNHPANQGTGIAPSMSGWSSMDRDRVTFEGVADEPIYLMSATTINIIQGHASEQFVKVFFDGKLIETIDIGVAPDGTPHNAWIGFNEYVEIPFDAYFKLTDKGELISLGFGSQNIALDANGDIYYLDSEGDPIEG